MLAQIDAPLADRVSVAPMPPLGAGRRQDDLCDYLDSQLRVGSLNKAPQTMASQTNTSLPLDSLLWLLAGDLDRSHDISQRLHTADGSLLHGIMHRREGDFSNAKYWFAKAPHHDVPKTLAKRFEDYGSAAQFVDTCEAAWDGGRQDDAVARCLEIQWAEWCLLAERLLNAEK